MVEAEWDDRLLDEQKRAGQEGANWDDSDGNDMASKHFWATTNKADINNPWRMREEDFPLSNNFLYHLRLSMLDACWW